MWTSKRQCMQVKVGFKFRTPEPECKSLLDAKSKLESFKNITRLDESGIDMEKSKCHAGVAE